MNHKPRPAIHLEKQLRWSRVSEDLQGRLDSISQVDGILGNGTSLWALWGGGPRKGTMASALFDARHLSLPLHAIGSPQATSPVLEPRGSESE